jgi:peptidoglycan/LPS O-acetylase OafA/YrhL
MSLANARWHMPTQFSYQPSIDGLLALAALAAVLYNAAQRRVVGMRAAGEVDVFFVISDSRASS